MGDVEIWSYVRVTVISYALPRARDDEPDKDRDHPALPACPALPALSEHGPEQDLSCRRMPEKRANQVTVIVELGRLANDRHDAVGARQLE
jgi:hypothetical protein